MKITYVFEKKLNLFILIITTLLVVTNNISDFYNMCINIVFFLIIDIIFEWGGGEGMTLLFVCFYGNCNLSIFIYPFVRNLNIILFGY